MRENEAGDQTVGLDVTVGDAISRAAEGLKRRIVPGAGVGPTTRRRTLWTITSILFVLGFAASTALAHAERNAALDSVVEQARDEAQFVAATLDGTRLSKPVKGSSYGRSAAKIRRSVSSKATIVGVTVWSSKARIVFSLDRSLVGTTRSQMQSLLTGMSQASNPPRIVDDTVQTFMPIANANGRTVAIVEVDQPLAAVEARIGGFWSTVRLGFGSGLVVSLLLLGLTFVSRRRAPAPEEHAEEPEHDVRQEASAAEMNDETQEAEATEMSDEQPVEPVTEAPVPWWEEQLQALSSDLARAVDQQTAPEGDLDDAVEQQTAPEGDLDDAAHEQTAPEGDLDDAAHEQTAPERDLDDAAHEQTAPERDARSQELMRQRREEFKARAERARLRGRKVQAELQEAASGTESAE